jgi:hypothetical protein
MRGDWNAEMRRLVAQQMMEHVPALRELGPWGVINHLHDTLVYSEEIYAQTREDYAARPPHSLLRAVAFVIDPRVEGARLLQHRFEGLLKGVITAGVFSDAGSAEAWMQQQLAGS